jgi:hypothetical protein
MKLRLTPRIWSSARDFSRNPDLDVLFKYARGREPAKGEPQASRNEARTERGSYPVGDRREPTLEKLRSDGISTTSARTFMNGPG